MHIVVCMAISTLRLGRTEVRPLSRTQVRPRCQDRGETLSPPLRVCTFTPPMACHEPRHGVLAASGGGVLAGLHLHMDEVLAGEARRHYERGVEKLEEAE